MDRLRPEQYRDTTKNAAVAHRMEPAMMRSAMVVVAMVDGAALDDVTGVRSSGGRVVLLLPLELLV